MSKKEISRRTFLKGTAAGGVMLAASGVLAACGNGGESSTPGSSTPVSTPSSSPASSPAGSGAEIERGVTTDGNGWYLWDEATGELNREGREATGENCVVSAGTYEASMAGIQIIEKGGNGVDACCAVGLALSLTEPASSGIGGGGFMTIHSADGSTKFINFREIAPKLATPEYWTLYTDPETGKTSVVGGANMTGGRAIGTPGEIAGMYYAFEKYGSGNVTWEDICQPAIDLAENGFYVTPSLASALDSGYTQMLQYPAFGETYLREDGMFYELGQLFKNPGQAKALKEIQAQGPDAFYKSGPLRDAMISAANRYGAVFIPEDFEEYAVTESEPVSGTYRGYTIYSTPLPSSGGCCIIQLLNILENFDLASLGHNSAEYIHLLSEAMKMVYADRSQYLGANTEQSVIKAMMSKEYAKALAEEIQADMNAVREPKYHDLQSYMSEDTTSFSVADKEGNMVTVTQTVNGSFGSKVFPDGYGFPLNNEMGDFSTDSSSPNAIDGGKCPLSSMSPTCVLDPDGKPFMTLGAPGATIIIVGVAQVILNVIDFGMNFQDAIVEPRFYDNTSNKIQYESRIDQSVIDKLVAMGHAVTDTPEEWNRSMCSIQGVMYGSDGLLYGGADPRRDNKAIGI